MDKLYDKSYTKPFEAVLEAVLETVINHNYHNTGPIFYYVAIGSANHRDHYPESNDRHEYPDYVANLPYKKKVLILIDPNTKTPLIDSSYDIKLINSEQNINTVITDTVSGQVSGQVSVQLPTFDKYIGSEINESGVPTLEIYTIRNGIYIDQNAYYGQNMEYVKFGRKFLIDLVSYALMTHPNSLLMVSNYTGFNWYHLQDELINMFDPEIQFDVRKRFLIDSRYYNDLGCYYNLTDRRNQPIIENGFFFNPGAMSPIEYNEFLHHILAYDHIIEDQNQANMNQANMNQKYIHNQKKSYILEVYSSYIKKHLNESYRKFRVQYNETKDLESRANFRLKMLEHIRELLGYIRDFVDIEQFINKLKTESVYQDESELKKLINSIIKIDNSILDMVNLDQIQKLEPLDV